MFKIIYEEMISVDQREKLGEYYTPLWLCDYITKPIIKDYPKAKMLDPSCGSGSFLFSIVKNKKELNNSNFDEIIDQICGFEVNPLAVSVAKSNLIIAFSDSSNSPLALPFFISSISDALDSDYSHGKIQKIPVPNL